MGITGDDKFYSSNIYLIISIRHCEHQGLAPKQKRWDLYWQKCLLSWLSQSIAAKTVKISSNSWYLHHRVQTFLQNWLRPFLLAWLRLSPPWGVNNPSIKSLIILSVKGEIWFNKCWTDQNVLIKKFTFRPTGCFSRSNTIFNIHIAVCTII